MFPRASLAFALLSAPLSGASACCDSTDLLSQPFDMPQSYTRVPHPHDSSIVVRVGLGRRPTAPARRSPGFAIEYHGPLPLIILAPRRSMLPHSRNIRFLRALGLCVFTFQAFAFSPAAHASTTEPGVSHPLAIARAARLSNLRYALTFQLQPNRPRHPRHRTSSPSTTPAPETSPSTSETAASPLPPSTPIPFQPPSKTAI